MINIARLVRRRLARKISLQLALVTALILGGLTWLVYVESMDRLQINALAQLREVAENRAREAGQVFHVAETSTFQLRDEYVRRLKTKGEADPKQDFDRWFGKWPDGVVRVRRELDDHTRLPSVYLRPVVTINSDVRRRTLTAFELLREWGPVLTNRFYSAYIDLPGEGLIMYSPSVNWGAEANADTNNFDYPPVQNAGPEKNPERKNNWTEVYFDDKAGIYMVSTVTPIDLNGRWIAAASQDVSIQDLLQRTHNPHLPGTYNLILSRDGNLIAHPELEEKIKAGGGNLRIADLHDAMLTDVLGIAQKLGKSADVAETSDGSYRLGMARIDGPDWLFVTVYPNELLRQEAFAATRMVLLLGAGGLLVLLLFMFWIIDSGVRAPLKTLEAAADDIAQGRRGLTVDLDRTDELGQLGRAFAYMVKELERHEQELRHANVTLEKRVDERTDALKRSNLELEETIQQLQRTQSELINSEKLAALGALVAGIAHELNTPIGNGVLITTTMRDHLRDLAGHVDAGTVRKSALDRYVADTQQASDILLRCLHSVADLVASFKQVAVDRSGSARRRFELHQVCHDVVSTLMPSISRTSHRLAMNVPSGIIMDSYPGALGQIVTNLVNNALLHGFEDREQGQMMLSVVPLDDQRIELRFRDSGVGIDAANMRRIFDPFFTTKMGQGGSGLGLHVVYNIITGLMGGRIIVQSEPGAGTEFVITLPLNAPTE